MGTQMRVTYPDSVSRYLRIRVLDGSAPRRIVAADLLYEVVSPAERLAAGVPLSPDASGRQSTWTSTAETAPIPISQVRFTTNQTRVLPSASGSNRATTDKLDVGGLGRDLPDDRGGASASRWRSRFRRRPAAAGASPCSNRDDAPLADLRPELYAIPRRVVFRAEPGRPYRLLVRALARGGAAVRSGQLTDVKTLESAAPAAIGAEVVNPAYADPAPWTERNQAVLWVALGIAVLVVGALAVRSLR